MGGRLAILSQGRIGRIGVGGHSGRLGPVALGLSHAEGLKGIFLVFLMILERTLAVLASR